MAGSDRSARNAGNVSAAVDTAAVDAAASPPLAGIAADAFAAAVDNFITATTQSFLGVFANVLVAVSQGRGQSRNDLLVAAARIVFELIADFLGRFFPNFLVGVVQGVDEGRHDFGIAHAVELAEALNRLFAIFGVAGRLRGVDQLRNFTRIGVAAAIVAATTVAAAVAPGAAAFAFRAAAFRNRSAALATTRLRAATLGDWSAGSGTAALQRAAVFRDRSAATAFLRAAVFGNRSARSGTAALGRAALAPGDWSAGRGALAAYRTAWCGTLAATGRAAAAGGGARIAARRLQLADFPLIRVNRGATGFGDGRRTTLWLTTWRIITALARSRFLEQVEKAGMRRRRQAQRRNHRGSDSGPFHKTASPSLG